MNIRIDRLATLIGMAILGKEEALTDLEMAKAEIEELKTKLPKRSEKKDEK